MMRYVLFFFAFTLGPLLGSAACSDPEIVCPNGPDGGLAAGEQYGDACNLCTCNEDGTITCKETSDCADCTHEGEGFAVGDTFPAGDGCNICQCEAKDTVSCTAAACG